MKLQKLLALSALWVSTSSAWAVDGNVWPKPTFPTTLPEVTEFMDYVEDTPLYLYNTKAHLFYTNGNNWATRASLLFATGGDGNGATAGEAIRGIEVEFQRTEAAIALGDNVVELKGDVKGAGTKLSSFAGGWNDVWTDNDTREDRFWTVTAVNGSYRISNVKTLPDYVLGWTGEDTRLYLLDPATEGAGVDWKMVSPEVYETYAASITEDHMAIIKGWQAEWDTYNEAQRLKDVLNEAESIGAAVADQVAVYNNTASTKDELTAAIKAAQDAITKRKGEMVDEQYEKATWDNPVVVTDKFIKNPDFKGDDLKTGWSGDAFGSYGPKENAEHYNKTYNTYQQVKGLKPGIYAVGVKAFYRAGNSQTALDNFMAQNAASKYAKLYGTVADLTREVPIVSACSPLRTEAAGVGAESSATYTNAETGETTTYYFPNNMEAAEHYMHQLGLYDNKVLVSVKDSLTLGVRKTQTVGEDWSIFDDFSLTYYGQGAEACQAFLDEAVKEYGDITIDEGTLYTESYLTAYRDALKADMKVSNLEELDAVLASLDNSKKDIDKNIALWKQWQDDLEKAYTNYGMNTKYADLESVGILTDYYGTDIGPDDGPGKATIEEEHNLTNEELEAQIKFIAETVKAIIDEAKNAIHEDGDDMTDFIDNPGFDDDPDIDNNKAIGWTIDNRGGGNVVRGPLGQANKDLMESSLGKMNYCFEAWHSSDFDVWQEIEDLPKGMYQLDVQGYVRYEGEMSGDGNTALNIWNNMNNIWDPNSSEIPESPISLYMNNAQDKFPNIFSEPKPADKEYVTVEGWTKNTDAAGNDWPNSMGGAAQAFAWGLYKSTAYGLIAKKGDTFRIGVKGKTDKGWWCIFDNFKLTYREPTVDVVKPILEDEIAKLDLSQPMGSNVYADVTKLKETATAALASNDGDQMFNALVEVYDMSESINKSVALFQTLNSANEDLQVAIGLAVAGKATKDAAAAMYEKVFNGIDNHDFADDEVEGLKNDIAKLINQLGLPETMAGATDSKPVECSGAIVNPEYNDGNDKGWTGGASVNTTSYDAEMFNKNYDYYQVLQGLPAGTYQVKLQGFFRYGPAANDYTTWKENPEANNNAFLYAVGEGGDTCSVALVRLASQAVYAESNLEGWVWASEADKLSVPNSMATAADVFYMYNEATGKEYFADNTVTVKVGEDGKLVIGLKKTTLLTDDWTIFKKWQLFYLGKDSQVAPDGDPSAIVAVGGDALQTEFFSLSGARIAKPSKGVAVVKQTLSDGTVRMEKVLVK